MTLEITGFGLVSAVGKGSDGCASVRCGLSRTDELKGFSITSDNDVYPQPILGAACRGMDGFKDYGRLAWLTVCAIQNLVETFPETAFSPIDLFVKIPASDERPALATALHNQEREKGEGDFVSFLDTFLARASFNIKLIHIHVCESKNRGIAELLEDIKQHFETGVIHSALLASVDSFLDSETINFFLSVNRIFCSDRSSGFIPGEGAAVFHLVKPTAPSIEEYTLLAEVDQWVTAIEQYQYPNPAMTNEDFEKPLLLNGTSISGLFEAIIKYDKTLAIQQKLNGYYDFNGEQDRRIEWTNALARLKKDTRIISEIMWQTSVNSFGYCGWANVLMALCCWVEYKRRKLLSGVCLLSAVHDSGCREVIVIK